MMQLQLGLQCDACGVVGLVNGSVYLICLIIILSAFSRWLVVLVWLSPLAARWS